ncbi:MAG: GntR family transcriptional regulator [Pseudonocardia sp.]
MTARAPKYQRVADILRSRIRGGEYGPRQRLPAESELAASFEVSLPTVRQAMSVLRAEGLVESRHGVGSFVLEQRRLQRRSRSRYGRARRERQLLTAHLRHDVVSAGREPVPAHVAEVLADAPDEVVVRRRVLTDRATGRVAELGASYLPLAIADGTYLTERAVVPKALFLCIEELAGRTYARARDRWFARMPTPDEAAALGLPTGAAVLHVMHIAEAADGTVLEVSESVWPADRIVLIDEYAIPAGAEETGAASEV